MIEPSIEELILSGVVEIAGIDSASGEFLYNFTPKLREVMAELYNERMQFIQAEVMFFLELNFLEVDDETSDGSPAVYLTDKAYNEREISKLSKGKQDSLREIKRLFEEK